MTLNSAAVQLGSTRREKPLAPDAPFYKKLWHGWQKVARFIGNILSRIVTTAAYVVVLPWFALFVRLLSDPLQLKQGPARWAALAPEPTTIADAKRGL